jgi:cleavage and polyadenylation specificity factor subunit 1
MGIKNSPDIFQEIMSNMMSDLENTSTYLDDILIISNGTFEEHLEHVREVLNRLEKANFRANINKCYWGEQSIEYLGYQISRKGIQPQPKKVEAIQKLKAPTNVCQLRHFLGMIVETLKEFKSLLWGQDITIHTDHMNIVYGNLSNDRITRWRLLLEEYSPKFVHIKGTDNVVADALSRMDTVEVEQSDLNQEIKNAHKGETLAQVMCALTRDESIYIPDPNNKDDMAQCYASKKDTRMESFPLDPAVVAKYQAEDKACKKYAADKKFKTRTMEGHKVLVNKNDKLVVPRKLQERILAWYHLYLRHPGATRMYKTMEIGFWWKTMRQDVEHTIQTCPQCQKNKKVQKKYGKLPPKQAETESKPWERVNVDLIGPLTVKTPSGDRTLNALTMIDPATGWFEIKEVNNRTAEAAADAFDDAWLSRYPRPKYIGFDNGGENKGLFREMTDNYGLTRKPTTNYNPQANGVVEECMEC